MDERVSLIETIFSVRQEIDMVKDLSGDDAQAFIDMINEASHCTISPNI